MRYGSFMLRGIHCIGLIACHRQYTEKLAICNLLTKLYIQAFPAAYLLDPAHAVDPGTHKFLPPWHALIEGDQTAVKDLLRRMAPRGKQSAVIGELLQFISAGYADKDFARAAMVSCFSPITVCHRCRVQLHMICIHMVSV